MLCGILEVESLARSVKFLLIIIFILNLILPLASAYYQIQDEDYGGLLTESQAIAKDWTFDQIFYQKFVTRNDSLAIERIINYRPSNFSTQPAIGSKYIRIGIAQGNDTEPHLTPANFYSAALADRWQMYAPYAAFSYTTGNKNYDMDYGNNYVEPNTEYYIIWYVWGDFWTSGDSIKFSCGEKGTGTFDEWSIHRGNVSSSVWTDPWPGGNNWTFDLQGWTMMADSTVQGWFVETANTTFWSDTEINENQALGRNWTYGIWLGNDTTDFGAFEQNITLKENSTDTQEFYEFTGLEPGKFYHLRGWICKNDSYPFIHGTEDYFLTKPDAPEHLIVSNRTAYNTTLMWENGTCSEEGMRTVVFKSTDSNNPYVTDPTSPGDAVIVYNATGSEGNFTTIDTGSEIAWYTAYSFIQREENSENLSMWSHDYSTNYSLPPLMDYTVYVYKEKWPYDLATVSGTNLISYEFATKDHVPILMGNTTSNPFTVYCNQSDLLTIRFINTTVNNWNGSVIERCYWIPISDNSSDRNISVYKPNADVGENRGNAKEVIFSYVDFTGYFTAQDYAIGIIRKSVENETVTIHSDYIQADNAIRTYLVQGDQYYFYARSDDLDEIRLGGIIIFEDEYTLEVRPDSITNNTWRSYVTIDSGWSGLSGENKTIWLRLTDSNQGLYSTTVRLYNASGTLLQTKVYTSTAYNFNYTYNTGAQNKSVYWANIYMKYHKGKLWWNDSTNYFWSTDKEGIEVDMPTLDGLINGSIGLSPLYIPATDTEEEVIIPWGTIIVTGIAISFFFLFQPEHSAFALIFMGAILGLLKLLGMVSESMLSVGVIGLIIAIGVILYIYFSGFTFWGWRERREKE